MGGFESAIVYFSLALQKHFSCSSISGTSNKISRASQSKTGHRTSSIQYTDLLKHSLPHSIYLSSFTCSPYRRPLSTTFAIGPQTQYYKHTLEQSCLYFLRSKMRATRISLPPSHPLTPFLPIPILPVQPNFIDPTVIENNIVEVIRETILLREQVWAKPYCT